jgi:tetratricopeptide (TPR) repeat protein
MGARDRAEDAMRSAQRFPGVGKLLAEKWSIGEQLNRTRLFSKDAVASLRDLVHRIEVLQGEHPKDRDWLRLLGRSRLMLALCPDRDLTNEQRIGLAEQAEDSLMKCLEKDPDDRGDGAHGEFVDRVWLAEAIAVRNRELSAHWAKESLLRRHAHSAENGGGGSQDESPESIDALFRALLFMGSTEEALAAFESRRDQVSLPERSVAQSLVASSCVRASVLRSIVLREEAVGLNEGKFVRLVMRLAPQSSDARALMNAWVNESPGVGGISGAEQVAEGVEDPAVAMVIHWLRRERQEALASGAGEPSRVFPEGWAVRQLDTEVLVGTVPLLMEWVGRKEITSQRALELLDAMRSAAPENLDLVYASAIVALQGRENDRAINDLRRLLEALPGNAQLESMLLAAYENATASKLQSPKGQGQRARGTPAGEGR